MSEKSEQSARPDVTSLLQALREQAPERKKSNPSAETPIEVAEWKGSLWSHVASLPDGQRQAMVLRFSEGLQYQEIAQVLDLPLGTVNNCSNGYTPWGTYLTCEENFNGYFGWLDPNFAPSEEQERYGFEEEGFGYGWHQFDARFDLSNPDFVNEENRFGWVVEIDPMDPTQTPVKRTGLGRFKHEGAAVTVGRGGRVVCYCGDDQRFDYIYKFVSASNWKSMRARGKSPFSEGTLYVARFDEDWNPRAFGDNVTAWGTPVVLIESGGLKFLCELPAPPGRSTNSTVACSTSTVFQSVTSTPPSRAGVMQSTPESSLMATMRVSENWHLRMVLGITLFNWTIVR